MKILNKHTIFSELCKSSKKWGLLISGWLSYEPSLNSQEDYNKYIDGCKQAIPYIFDCNSRIKGEFIQIFNDGMGYLLFDSEKEMEEYYYKTIGDDGPIKPELNDYNGEKCKVYALTCDSNGNFLNENT